MKKIVPIILCGGSGTRLWPKSRAEMPKQFLKLLDDNSLLQATAIRALNVLGCAAENVVTITIADMKAQTEQQLNEINPGLTNHILTEPIARNTAAAVAYATHYVWETFGEDAYAWILLSDHYIGDEVALKTAVESAYGIAEQDYIVTFGIEPTRPETGFGYIKKSTSFESSSVYSVEKFVEKPPLNIAEEYFESGQYLWSSGMHLFKVKKALKCFHNYAKESIRLVETSMSGNHSKHTPSKEIYGQIKSESFETAILEKTQHVAVVPCDIGWSDLGTFNSLWEISEKDPHGNVTSGNVACYKAENCIVQAEDRLVTCVGVKDLTIIETADAILIADKHRSDDLKVLVQGLKDNRPDVVHSHYKIDYRWGSKKIISKSFGCQTFETIVRPSQNQCYHMHGSSSKLCTVISGTALIKIGDEVHKLGPQENFLIESRTPHLIINNGSEDLYMIEVQYGVKDGSLDIIRIDDTHQAVA